MCLRKQSHLQRSNKYTQLELTEDKVNRQFQFLVTYNLWLNQYHTALQVTQIYFITLLRAFYVWDWGNMMNEALAELIGSYEYCTKNTEKIEI